MPSAMAMARTRSSRSRRMVLYSVLTAVRQEARLARFCSRVTISWLSGTAAAERALKVAVRLSNCLRVAARVCASVRAAVVGAGAGVGEDGGGAGLVACWERVWPCWMVARRTWMRGVRRSVVCFWSASFSLMRFSIECRVPSRRKRTDAWLLTPASCAELRLSSGAVTVLVLVSASSGAECCRRSTSPTRPD